MLSFTVPFLGSLAVLYQFQGAIIADPGVRCRRSLALANHVDATWGVGMLRGSMLSLVAAAKRPMPLRATVPYLYPQT